MRLINKRISKQKKSQFLDAKMVSNYIRELLIFKTNNQKLF